MIVWASSVHGLFYVLINFSYYRTYPLDIIKLWQGGPCLFPAGLSQPLQPCCVSKAPPPLLLVHRRPLGALACSGPGHRPDRVLHGRMLLRPAHGFVMGRGVYPPEILAPLNLPLYPTQVFEAFGGFADIPGPDLSPRKTQVRGTGFPLVPDLHSTARLLVERFRGDERGLIAATENDLHATFSPLDSRGVRGWRFW